MSGPLAYSVAEAATLAGCGRSSLYIAMRAGRLPARKFGMRTLILATDLQQWLASLPPAYTHAAPPARAA